MLIDGSSLKINTSLEADVCIMGGGVAGLVLAKELAINFDKIIVIESGGENFSPESQELNSPGAKSNSFFPDPLYSRMRFLGGSSNHWENNTSPLDPIDFETRDWIANSGWPIRYDDIVQYYPAAGEYCGVKSDGYKKNFWLNKLDKKDIFSDSSILETAIAKASRPPTRFFYDYKKEISSLSAVDIYTNSNVVDVEFDGENNVIKKVFFESVPGFRHEVKADVCIMCMGGIENARMLLTFNEKYNNKIGNNYDNVGRYFMDHPVVRAAHFYPHDMNIYSLYKPSDLGSRIVLGFWKLKRKTVVSNKICNIRMPLVPATNYTLSDGISSHHIIKDALSNGELPDNFGQHILNFAKDIDMVIEAISRKKFKEKLFDHADDKEAYQMPVMVEQTPHRDNRVRLGDVKDRFGTKRVEIDWEVKPDDKDRMWKALGIVANEVGANSLGRVRLLKDRSDRIWGDQLGFGHHHMGTTRMSSNYNDGVTDAAQKVFGTNNLFVAGSSVFPTGGHVPPTLTIVAMTIRLARHISREYSHGR